MIDDLDMIFGYRGAEATGDASLVAPDIVCMPFWTPEFCDAVIRACHATGEFEPQPEDPVPGYEVSLAVVSPTLFDNLQNDIGRRLWPAIRRWWPLVDYYGIRDAFVIRYREGEQEELRLHHDVAQVSASIKLNDSYRGAELEFPQQGFTNTNIPVGHVVAWPSLVTHPHRSKPLISGEKYSLTIWCELPLVIS